VVLEEAASPRMQRHPNQNADDIGARFADPSAFSELINTTGVPKYRIGGSPVTCSLLMVIASAPFTCPGTYV
jgi:hypothetical protein